MDWSKIKTIFIISFLILDIYLAYQFINTRSEAKNYEFIKEVSLEEKLKNDDIDIEFSTPSDTIMKERYVSVRPKIFVKDELLSNQTQQLGLGDGAVLRGKLDKPIELNEKFKPEEFTAAVMNDVQSGEEYRFWKKDDEENTITYFQQYKGKPIYHNLNGKLTFFINDQNEVTSYEQTYLEPTEELMEEEEVITPMEAIETLYKKGLLSPKSKITKAELGYSTLVQLTASQVLAPTWRILVNGEGNLFVHAFEGQVIQLNSEESEVTE
ncbi:two-component system regulatory protein YycI [Mesobacillus foraminis]|uniref:two-component system regulatory protein YycI n=1 Tax=Mesobacillus foraminis TaxID=279826 RepID=UPI000EF4DB1C|nr:two-component system regulatory protein YycI [Mesobacillus foraminis]